MIPQSILVLALLGGHGGPFADSRVVTKPAGWTLAVVTDRFTGKLSCSLERRHVRVVGNWATLELGKYVDTENAEVRLDDKAARSVHVFARPFVDPNDTSRDAILNPSGGRVVLPVADLAGARTAWVRPTPRAHVARFDLTGLSAAVAAAHKAGCPADKTDSVPTSAPS